VEIGLKWRRRRDAYRLELGLGLREPRARTLLIAEEVEVKRRGRVEERKRSWPAKRDVEEIGRSSAAPSIVAEVLVSEGF